MNKVTQLLKKANVYQQAAMLISNWDSLNLPPVSVHIHETGVEVELRASLVIQNPEIKMHRNPELLITLDEDDGIAYAYVCFALNIFVPGKEDWQDPCRLPEDIKEYLETCGYFVGIN